MRVHSPRSSVAARVDRRGASHSAEEHRLLLAALEKRDAKKAVALIHEHLYGNDHLDRVHFGEYARELAQHVYDVSVADPQRISLRIEAEPIDAHAASYPAVATLLSIHGVSDGGEQGLRRLAQPAADGDAA